MAAFPQSSEGYASARTRKAALFDPLLGAHPFDKNRLLTDRSAYVSFLEVQLERVTAACLATQGFSERIEQLQTQINALEMRTGNSSSNRHFPVPAVCSCQTTCARLADDALAAVQAVDEKVEKSKKETENRLSEISTRVLDLLRQVVTKQRDMQLKISGNLDISDLPHSSLVSRTPPPPSAPATSGEAEIETAAVTPSATLRVSAEPLQEPTRPASADRKFSGARMRAVSAPGAAAAQARRRRAIDELLKELEILEREGN